MSDNGSCRETDALISTSDVQSEVGEGEVFSHCNWCPFTVQLLLSSPMSDSNVLNFRKWTNPPSAFPSRPINTEWCVTWWQPPGDLCPSASLYVPAVCKRKEGKGLLWRLTASHPTSGAQGSSGHLGGPMRIRGGLSRGPETQASFSRKRKQVTMCWAPCNRHCAPGVISFISHASPWGKYYSPRFMRRKFKDHTTVKSKVGIRKQSSPAPEHCLARGKKNWSQIRSDFTHARISLRKWPGNAPFNNSDLLIEFSEMKRNS